MSNCKIGFLGAGRMATAIAGGMVKSTFSAKDVMAYDCSAAAGKAFADIVGIEMHSGKESTCQCRRHRIQSLSQEEPLE